MRGLRGLLTKDLLLFKSQGLRLLCALLLMAFFFTISGSINNGYSMIYMATALGIYAANTISYDEAGNGFGYLFALPVSRKVYVREKYLFTMLLTLIGWLAGIIYGTVAALIRGTGEISGKILVENLAESLAALLVIVAIEDIVIAIRMKFEGEKGRLVFPILFFAIFGVCYMASYIVKADTELAERFQRMAAEAGDAGIMAGLVVVSLLVIAVSYVCSMKFIKEKEF